MRQAREIHQVHEVIEQPQSVTVESYLALSRVVGVRNLSQVRLAPDRIRVAQFVGIVMSGSNAPRALGIVLKEVISSLGIESRIARAHIVATWTDIVGERIGREVERAWVKDRKLFVRIKSPVWRQELHQNRASWCRRLNEELGSNLVKEIVFR